MQITPDQCRLIMLLAELCIKHNLLPTDEYLEALELMEFVQINRGNDMTDKTVQATPELPVSQQLLNLVEAQAQDGGLWFEAKTAPEAYLQQELRKLHAAIEARAIQAMPELPELPVVAWLTGAGILTSNFFYKESWIPKPVDQPLCKVSDALTYAESLRSENADLKKRAYFHPENHSKTLQQIFSDLHLFEEVAEHYAQCGMSPESMRNWVVDKNTEVDQLKAELEAARAALKPLVAEPVYVQVRHKTEYGMSEWSVPLDPKEQHSTWADGVEMRLLYTTPPSTSIGGAVTDDVKYECVNAAWGSKKWYSSATNTKPVAQAEPSAKSDFRQPLLDWNLVNAFVHQKVARLEKSLELARRLLTVATWAAGKIIIERKRGASTAPHAEVDALVCANESIRSWLITTGWSGCIESAPTLEEIAAIASTTPGATP